MLIPALCGIVIAKTRKQKPVIQVESKVISRDGLWFLACELVLIVFLFQPAMTWQMAVTLLGMYAIYVYMLVLGVNGSKKSLVQWPLKKVENSP